jgi:plasmid stabilization system protein ParE
MEDKVRLTDAAYEQIDNIVAHIARDSSAAAQHWRINLFREIDALQYFPLKHGLAPEAERAGTDLRQTFFGMYRILYRVRGEVVTVHGVRHGRRRALRRGELSDLS